jgi:branched-chain amino acid transport system substrate-binding protein
MKTVGEGGKGYKSISWSVPVSDAPVMQDIKKYVLDAKVNTIGEGEFDWVFYQRGVLISMFLTEGIKTAQEHFNAKVITPEQLRWGLENLNFDEARIKALGADGMIAPFKTTCADHAGHAGGWILQWDGSKFVKASDLLTADRDAIVPLEQAKAKEYAEANKPWPTNDECKM